jgi:hypothetical protein
MKLWGKILNFKNSHPLLLYIPYGWLLDIRKKKGRRMSHMYGVEVIFLLG